MADIPRYLRMDATRILDHATIRPMTGGNAWMDIEVSGLLLRFVLTPKEIDDLIGVLQDVKSRLLPPETPP